MKNKRRIILWSIYGALLVILIAFFVLLLNGWRVRTWHFIAPYKINVTLPFANASLFVDGNDTTPTDGYGTTTTLSLPVGTHTIIISKTGYWPWTKEIVAGEKTTGTLAPFLALQNTTGVIITAKDPEYTDFLKAFLQKGTPTTWAKKTSLDGTVRIWANGTSVYAEPNASTTDQTITVVSATTEIRALDFYKGRSDVLVFATDTGIYAIEVVKTSSQNFQPIYKGVTPDFRVKDNSSLYVIDGTEHMIVTL